MVRRNCLNFIQRFHRDLSSPCHVCSAWEKSRCFRRTDSKKFQGCLLHLPNIASKFQQGTCCKAWRYISSKFPITGISQTKHVHWKQVRPLVRHERPTLTAWALETERATQVCGTLWMYMVYLRPLLLSDMHVLQASTPFCAMSLSFVHVTDSRFYHSSYYQPCRHFSRKLLPRVFPTGHLQNSST